MASVNLPYLIETRHFHRRLPRIFEPFAFTLQLSCFWPIYSTRSFLAPLGIVLDTYAYTMLVLDTAPI